MDDTKKKSFSVRLQPSLKQRLHLTAIRASQTVESWVEEAIREKLDREEKKKGVKKDEQ